MPKSIYEEIYKDLKEKIESQEFAYESLLPSENELIQIYHCSRNTIRRAISCLTSEGYTQPMHGRGVRVIYSPNVHQEFLIQGIEGFQQVATAKGYKVTNRVITFTEMTVDAHTAEKSGLEEGTEVYYIQRIRSLDGVPKMIDTSLLRKDLVPVLTKKILNGSLFQYIENEIGMPIRTIKRRITVERATSLDEKYLVLDNYNCLAVITSQVFNADGIQFEYTISRNRPDIFSFTTVISHK
ncbi:MAG: GntR family transcriptional regulator [Lachnospiraceae bacterium]